MEGIFAFVLYGLATLASGLSAIFVLRSREHERPDRGAAVAALAFTAIWAGSTAALGTGKTWVHLAEIVRNLAWIYLLFRLFANDGRDETIRAVRPLALAIGLVEALQLLIVLAGASFASRTLPPQFALETSALLRILVGIGALVLLHNLIAGAAQSSRRLLAWNAGGLALLWGYNLNFYTVAFLTGGMSAELAGGRALVAAVAVTIFAIGYARSGAEMRFRPSRSVAFSMLSLGLIAIYLLAMIVLSKWVGSFSGDLARVTQVGFLLAAAALSILWLPSQRFRSWLRVVALKNLFQHRFDYRNEWIRFTHTIGRADAADRPLSARAIQSLADITGSQAGLLLTSEPEGHLALVENWHWSALDVPAEALPAELGAILEANALIIDFDESREGGDHHGELRHIPHWLLGEPKAWAAVPLLHHGRLVGVVVLSRPQVSRQLDWEDFDLLSIAGQQVASYLAEQAGQQALEEAARFDEFNRRMAFVMHDIKNLSSQMGLLARNAEKHAENPEFRKDMLVTLRSSTDKLDGLLARLGRYGTGRSDPLEEFDLVALARDLQRRYEAQHPVRIAHGGPCRVLGVREALDQALSHLALNAIEASPPGTPIFIEVANDGVSGSIALVDEGPGMSPSFVRNRLFRPFLSSKQGGFGIGACEARDLVRGMGGRLEVDSREGAGTRFTISLPNAAAARLSAAMKVGHSNSESEAA